MKVLVIGGGGREHALVWKIKQSPMVDRLYCAPGNPGIARHATCVDIAPDNLDGLLQFAKSENIGLTVVGPEGPLVKGIVNLFTEHGLKIFGPTREAAEIEGSKVFCKNLLRKYGIPSPTFRIFNTSKSALAFVKTNSFPIVIKADGLASGKGVVICHTYSEAVVTIEGMIDKKIFGPAGDTIVIEEFLPGVECSMLVLTDGKTIVPLETSMDYKKVHDGNKGPNTGGMGAFSPAPIREQDIHRTIKEILVPVVHAMNREKRRYKGLLYAGLMLTRGGPKVLEFNARFGDPETQPLMARLTSDLVPLMLATVDEALDPTEVTWDPRPALCVVMTARGYPGRPEADVPITGIEQAESTPDTVVFHAGTAMKSDTLVTSGGRVLGVTSLGETLADARSHAYAAVQQIQFANAHYRKDIGLDVPIR